MKIYITEHCLHRGTPYAPGDVIDDATDSDASGILESGRGTQTAPAPLSPKAAAKIKAETEAAEQDLAEANAAQTAAREEAIRAWASSPELQAQFEGNVTAYLTALSNSH